jgi:hypothetical protein
MNKICGIRRVRLVAVLVLKADHTSELITAVQAPHALAERNFKRQPAADKAARPLHPRASRIGTGPEKSADLSEQRINRLRHLRAFGTRIYASIHASFLLSLLKQTV